MPSSLLELIFKTSKSGTGGKAAANELKELKGTVGELSQGLTGMNIAGVTALGAVTAIGAYVQSSVGKWSDYAEAIGKAADVSGVLPEEMSRIYQAADDARVSTEQLTSAFEKARKNGFTPTIENLAELADRIKGMDPLQRAAEMTKIFGKSWEDVYPFLKDGGEVIRDNTAAIDDSMIVTQQAVDQNREYLALQDNLNDSVDAFGYAIGRTLVPLESQALDFLTLATHMSVWNALSEMGRQKQDALTQAIEAQRGEMQAVNQVQDTFIGSFNKMTEAESGFTSSAMSAASAVRDNLSQAIKEQGTIQAQLADATKDLAAKQKEFGQSLATDVSSQLEQAGVKGTDLKDALRTVDTQMGTNLLTTQEQKEAIQKLVDQYARDDDLLAFSTGLNDINEKFSPLNESIKESRDKVSELNFQLSQADMWIERLNGSHIKVTTEYESTGTPPSGSRNPNPKGTTPWEGANGLYGIVPAGHPTDTFPILARSGEEVIINPPGVRQGYGGGGSVNLYGDIYLANGMDLVEFKLMLAQALRG